MWRHDVKQENLTYAIYCLGIVSVIQLPFKSALTGLTVRILFPSLEQQGVAENRSSSESAAVHSGLDNSPLIHLVLAYSTSQFAFRIKNLVFR